MSKSKQQEIKILLELQKKFNGLFYNTWVGSAVAGGAKIFVNAANLAQQKAALKPGDVVVKNGRMVKSGLPKGFLDILGAIKIKITPEMVGKEFAIFANFDSKMGSGKLSKEQIQMIEIVKNNGGISGEIRSPEEAEKVVNAEIDKIKK